jgi:hypothetical protein
LRRAISILLLAVLSFPLVSSLFVYGRAGAESLPICCRNNGKHHCMLISTMGKSSAQAGTQFRAPIERCPYLPGALKTAHADAVSLFAPINEAGRPSSHPASVAQTESKWRIARDRSRQKRGPPSLLG